MGAAASSRSGRRSDPAFGIGVGSVRGKCGAVEFGPSVITDDDAFQDAQDEIARANQSKSERKGQAKPVGNAASASTTTSKRVIERRRRSNTPPQVKKAPLPPPAMSMDASLGSSSSSSAATTKDGPAGGNAKPSRARKTSTKEKVESFFIRGKSIKTKALLDPGTANGDDDTVRNSASNAARGNDAAGARVRSPPAGTELVYRQNQPSSIHDDADSILNIKTLNASSARPSPSHEHRRPAAGSSASTSGAQQQQQQQQQQHRVATSLGNVALNNTNNDGVATLSGDSCMIARQGEEGVFDSYFLCAACAGNSLLSKLTAKGATSSSSPMGKMSSFKRQQLQRSGSSMTRSGGTSPKPDTSPSTSLRRSNSNLTSPSQSPSSSKAGVGGRGSGTCYIFVSSMGFRFYKPGGNGLFPFAQFPLDKIHSWAFEEKTKSFSFRFFELEEKQLVEYAFTVQACAQLREELGKTITTLVSGRQSKLLRDDAFASLIDKVMSGAADGSGDSWKLETIKESLGDVYISSDQGVVLLDMIEDEFDKVDCACFVHSRMLNQNHFHVVVESLDIETVKNIWHHILA